MRRILFITLLLLNTNAFATDFRAMTYNIWGRPWPLPSEPSRFPKIVKFLADHKPDVIAFQEAFSRPSRKLKKIPGYPFHAVGNGGAFGRTNSGLLTVSRHPIIRVEKKRYSDCDGTDCFARKGALLVTLLVPEIGMVDVVSTHLNAAGGDEVREAQIWELIMFIVDKHKPGIPLILLGDFNFQPSSPLYQLITEKSGLVLDTHQKFVDENPDLPQPVRQGWTKPAKPNKPGKRIDYIFATRELTPLNSVSSKVMMSHSANGGALSDHFAVEVLFKTE